MPDLKHSPDIKRKGAYHHGDLRQSFVNAALKLVAQKGPAGFTLAESAKLAGVVPSSLYRHFADREALLAAVALEGYEILIDRVRSNLPPTESGNEIESLIAFGESYHAFAMEYPAHFQVMFGSEINKKNYPELLAAACHTLALLTGITQDIAVEGKELAAAAWSMIHGLSLLTLDNSLARTGLSDHPDKLLRVCLPYLAKSFTPSAQS